MQKLLHALQRLNMCVCMYVGVSVSGCGGGGAWLALTLVVSVSHVAACEAVKLNTRCLGPRISSLTSISRSLLRVYTFWVCVCV